MGGLLVLGVVFAFILFNCALLRGLVWAWVVEREIYLDYLLRLAQWEERNYTSSYERPRRPFLFVYIPTKRLIQQRDRQRSAIYSQIIEKQIAEQQRRVGKI